MTPAPWSTSGGQPVRDPESRAASADRYRRRDGETAVGCDVTGRLRPAALGAVAFAGAAVLTWVVPDFRLYQLSVAGVLAVAIVGVTILTGRCGQLSLGHGAFVGLGAYVAAIAVRDYAVPYAVAGAAVLCFLVGLLLGVPAIVLPVNGLAVVTLAGALALPQAIKKFDGLTGGAYGVFLPRGAQLHSPWRGLTDDQFCYLVVLGALALASTLGWNLARGRWGLAMMAVRDHPVAAASMGVDLRRTKVLAFASSAAFAAAAGGLHVALVGSITPNDLTIALSFTLVTAAVIGGLGSVAGAALGALFVTLLPRYTGQLTSAAPGVAIGAISVALLVLAPTGLIGIAPTVMRSVQRVRLRVGARPPGSVAPGHAAAPR